MDNFEDKHIDDLFRDGSDQHDFPYKESSWDKMEAMILADKEDKSGIVYWPFALAFFVITSIAIYFYAGKKNNILEPSKTNEIALQVNPENNKKAEASSNEIKTSIRSKELDKETVKTEQNILNKQQTKQTKTNNSNTNKKTITEPIFSTNKKINTQINSMLGLQKNELLANNAEKATYSKVKTIDLLDESSLLFSPIESIDLKTINRFQSFDERISIPQPKVSNNNFGLGLILGREYSSVGLMNKSTAGYRIGLELVYQFNKKFELSAATIFSKKNYITEAQNYSFSTGMMNNIQPEMVHGSCDVTEIPVEFSYFLKSFDHSGFYLSAGASTFLMRKEWYDFEYDSMHDNNNDLTRSWADEGINNHLFGVGTISLGYQKILNKNFALQVEPYFQIPFTGIGTGEVDLVSAGLQLKILLKK